MRLALLTSFPLLSDAGRQLPLFAVPLAIASRQFPKWHRKLDEVRICAKCGREIMQRRVRDEVVSEFMANGLCFNCHRARQSRSSISSATFF